MYVCVLRSKLGLSIRRESVEGKYSWVWNGVGIVVGMVVVVGTAYILLTASISIMYMFKPDSCVTLLVEMSSLLLLLLLLLLTHDHISWVVTSLLLSLVLSSSHLALDHTMDSILVGSCCCS